MVNEMASKSTKFDEYVQALPAAQRAALVKLRRMIRAAAPDADEGESYGLPAFRRNGRPLAAMSAAAKHCSFFPMDGAATSKFAKELQGFECSKGTIRFTPDQPLPAGLVKKIILARIADLNGKKTATKKPAKSVTPDEKVTSFFADLKHSLREDYDLVTSIILAASPTITAGIKWNSVSFRTTEWFATINWRKKDTVQVVFHLGAKVKDNSKAMKIADPAGLMHWLAADRCLVTLGTGAAIKKNRGHLVKIVKAWIRYV